VEAQDPHIRATAWIAKVVQLLEANKVNWTFWPYQKMDATSSIV
jgi:hypothetical protein